MRKIVLRAISLWIDLFFIIIIIMTIVGVYLESIQASEGLFQVLPFFIIESVIFPLGVLLSSTFWQSELIFKLVIIATFIIETLYYFITERFLKGATLGKYISGIKTNYIKDLSNSNVIIRSILKTISRQLLGIPFIFALFNEKNQTLHDIISDTIVVKRDFKNII